MTENKPDKELSEIERLQYKSNNVPFILKSYWVAVVAFIVVYLVVYSWPDLLIWIKK